MLFLITILACIGFSIVFILSSDYGFEVVSFISGFISVIAAITAVIMIIVIAANNLGVDATIAEYDARYDMLTYQYENDIYDNDNDLGKRELIVDIQEWNEDLSYRKEIQDDLWLGIFYPNIHDQFEFIELGDAS